MAPSPRIEFAIWPEQKAITFVPRFGVIVAAPAAIITPVVEVVPVGAALVKLPSPLARST